MRTNTFCFGHRVEDETETTPNQHRLGSLVCCIRRVQQKPRSGSGATVRPRVESIMQLDLALNPRLRLGMTTKVCGPALWGRSGCRTGCTGATGEFAPNQCLCRQDGLCKDVECMWRWLLLMGIRHHPRAVKTELVEILGEYYCRSTATIEIVHGPEPRKRLATWLLQYIHTSAKKKPAQSGCLAGETDPFGDDSSWALPLCRHRSITSHHEAGLKGPQCG